MKSKKILSFTFSIALMIWALNALMHELHSVSYRTIVQHFQDYPIALIFLALGLAFLGYVLLSGYEFLGMKYLQKPIEPKKVFKISFLANAFANNVGSSVLAGPLLRHRFYATGLGLNTLEAVQMVLFVNASFLLGLLSLLGVCVLAFPSVVSTDLNFHFPSLVMGLLLLSMPAFYLGCCFVRMKPLQWKDWSLQFPPFKIGFLQIIVSAADWLLTASIFYVLLNTFNCPFFVLCAVFLAASTLGVLSQVPAGIGVFEAVMTAGLSPWDDAAKILATVLMFRTVYYLLPLCLASGILVKSSMGRWGKVLTETQKNLKELSLQLMPHFMALLIFIAGSMLLFSGSLPVFPDRLNFLESFFSLHTVEISHFFGSFVGLFLVLLARGIQKRVNVSYYFALVCLSMGALLSILNGLAYIEAMVLMVLFFLFLPCKDMFYKKSKLTAEVFTPAWLLAIVVVLLCSIWIGFFTYKHVEYSDDLWWSFAWEKDSTRFMRASVGVIFAFLIVGISKLFSTSRTLIKEEISHPDLDQIMPIVQASDNPAANLAFLGDKLFLFSQSKKSFLMYGVNGKTFVALGDPVGPKEEWDELTRAFVDLCEKYDARPVFYEADSENVHHYLDHGFYLLKLGEEAKVPVQSFTLQGGKVAELRHACTRAEKAGFVFEVCPREKVIELLPQLKVVSDTWLNEKTTKEKGFSLGFFSEDYLKHFPIAVVKKENKIVAFTNIWMSNQKKVYSIDLMRYMRNESPKGVMDYLFCQMILWGKDQGFEYFSLGMAPLAGLSESSQLSIWNRVGDFIFNHGEHFYNFEGLRSYKEKYGPVWNSRYLVVKNPLSIPYVLKDITSLGSGGLKGVFLK